MTWFTVPGVDVGHYSHHAVELLKVIACASKHTHADHFSSPARVGLHCWHGYPSPILLFTKYGMNQLS